MSERREGEAAESRDRSGEVGAKKRGAARDGPSREAAAAGLSRFSPCTGRFDMTGHRTLPAALVTTMCLAIGCNDELPPDDAFLPPDDAAVGYRAHGLYEREPDLGIHLGPTADDPDGNIWDLLGTGVQGGPASSTPGELILQVDGRTIRDGEGVRRCEYSEGGGALLHLVDLGTGEVLLTNGQVFTVVGDWRAGTGEPLWKAADYAVRDHTIRRGGWWSERLLSSTEQIGQASGRRQLLIGALIEGLCGAPGLYADPEPPPLPTEG